MPSLWHSEKNHGFLLQRSCQKVNLKRKNSTIYNNNCFATFLCLGYWPIVLGKIGRLLYLSRKNVLDSAGNHEKSLPVQNQIHKSFQKSSFPEISYVVDTHDDGFLRVPGTRILLALNLENVLVHYHVSVIFACLVFFMSVKLWLKYVAESPERHHLTERRTGGYGTLFSSIGISNVRRKIKLDYIKYI